MEYQRSALYDWIEDVILASELHSKADWALLCGVTEQMVDRWINHELIPSAESLRALYLILFENKVRPSKKVRNLRERWRDMETKTLLEVAPSHIPEANMPLGRYVLLPALINLKERLSHLSYEQQEEVVSAALEHATKKFIDNEHAEQTRCPVRIRFHGHLNSINDGPKSWDYTVEYPSSTEAFEAIQDYLADHDEGSALFDRL